MVDQPLGRRVRQHELVLGHGDESVAQTVEPELHAEDLAGPTAMPVKFPYMLRLAGERREHPTCISAGIASLLARRPCEDDTGLSTR